MYQIDFNRPIHIHFIGIGGISMSGLASILLDRHFQISGSDAKESPLTKWMEEKGIKVFYGQSASNIEDGTDVVVYTAAIHPDNPEFSAAVQKGIPMLTRAELLGQIMSNYETPIAVSGTHGKMCIRDSINKLHAKIQSVRHIHEEDRFPVCINLSCLLHLGRKSDERSQILPREYECMLAMCKVQGQVLYLLLRFRIMFPNLSRYLLPV